MCGIVGKAGRKIVKDANLLRLMRDTMVHRGPDDAGEWWSEDGTVGMAMRRLAIIDLSPAGHQPMLDKSGKLAIVFNGEIYNYRELRDELAAKGHLFKTSSDTEAILEAYREWGTDCVGRLNGMFAFALFDIPRRELFLARDRAGEKPLFYRHEEGRFWFGSELKSILADKSVGRKLNRISLEYYLTFGYVPGELCILDGFVKLSPAHAMTYHIDSDRLNVWRYWQLPESEPSTAADEEELAEELEALLKDSVRRQLIADVPVGIMLSGGVDSSLVTALAAATSNEKVKTFTVTFPGFGTFNEAPYARIVADHFATEHTELEAGMVQPEIMAELARQFDEPIADSSMIPTYMVSKLIRRHATVALGGDGGDELFGGYMHYSLILKAAGRFAFIPGIAKLFLRRGLETLLPPGFPYKDKALLGLYQNPHDIVRNGSYFDQRNAARVLAGHRSFQTTESQRFSFNKYHNERQGLSLLRSAMGTDFLNYLPSDVLVKVDRASMLASLETRAPFLDHRVIEFAFSRVPDSMKATEDRRKILLKKLARKILPPQLDIERKQGFSIPLGDWFKKGWGVYMTEVLLDSSQTLFDRKAVSRLARLQYKDIFNYQRLYALTMLELWRRKYDIVTN